MMIIDVLSLSFGSVYIIRGWTAFICHISNSHLLNNCLRRQREREREQNMIKPNQPENVLDIDIAVK